MCPVGRGSAWPSPVVKAPDIYLFDDSFSALDYDTDARLRAALSTITDDGVQPLRHGLDEVTRLGDLQCSP